MGRLHSNWDPDNPVARTVNVSPSNWLPAVVVKPAIVTSCPATKLFAAWNVTTFEVIENPVMVATLPQVAPEQAAKGVERSVISVSGLLVPVEMVSLAVLTSAIEPASQMLTYTWLPSEAGVANIRNRVAPGV